MGQGTGDEVQKSSPCTSGPPALVPVYLSCAIAPQTPHSLTQAVRRTCRSVNAQDSLPSLAQVLSAWVVLAHVICLPARDSHSLLASRHERPSTVALTAACGTKGRPRHEWGVHWPWSPKDLAPPSSILFSPLAPGAGDITSLPRLEHKGTNVCRQVLFRGLQETHGREVVYGGPCNGLRSHSPVTLTRL